MELQMELQMEWWELRLARLAFRLLCFVKLEDAFYEHFNARWGARDGARVPPLLETLTYLKCTLRASLLAPSTSSRERAAAAFAGCVSSKLLR